MAQHVKLEESPPMLQSTDHRDLLDIVDRLRAQGLNRFVDLPQIIVCGDQSSGKSSALEAISGMSFPSKDNLCTRFATELILRRSPSAGVDISINPGAERTDSEKEQLRRFTYAGNLDDLDVGTIVDNAKAAMGLSGNTKVFSNDTLRIELSGPSQPHLTMVDLPGLFLAGNKDQSDEDAALVEKLVLSYMKKPRTIILAVVSAKNDFALQQVTRHTRALDPEGSRTLGLITKPDTIDKGSETEAFYVNLAKNKDVQFSLGWHVLRNRNYQERDHTTSVRDATETDFFSTGVWTCLKPSQLGIDALKVRLSNVLREQIISQLPSVLQDVAAGILECKDTLNKLGAARPTVSEQRRYLLIVSAKFSSLLTAAIDGVYTDVFFEGAYERRLRAVVQNTLREFAADMRAKGHARTIVEDVDDPFVTRPTNIISRSKYLKEVNKTMEKGRGRELPGTFNPILVAELFNQQCKPWTGIVQDLVEQIFRSAAATIESVLRHVADKETAKTLLVAVVEPAMGCVKAQLTMAADEILQDYTSSHPITYNHYLTENVQKAQAQRMRKRMEKHLGAFFGGEVEMYNKMGKGATNHHFNMKLLLDHLATSPEPDMDKYSCSMAADMMEAYYKVALKTIIDTISNHAIERCLQKLPSMLTTETVCDLGDNAVQRIAAENPEAAADRAQATDKLGVLEAALAELRVLKMHRSPVDKDVTAVE